MPINTDGIIGTDGYVPVYNPNGLWKIWELSEIFLGKAGKNKYVPKLQDYVVDSATFTTYIVHALDELTLIPTLVEIRPANMNYSFTESDILLGTGPGTQADTYRAYYNKSTNPATLTVDQRCWVGGSMSSYAKIFKGPVIPGGLVISKIFDNSGKMVSQNVPLEQMQIDNHTNFTRKTLATCGVTDELIDGEILTIVFYSDNGIVVSKRQVIVEESTFITDLSASKKYVTHISLKSVFLKESDPDVISFPINLTMQALNLFGVVHYSDGSTAEFPVDGTKFTMLGLSGVLASREGLSFGLVLVYKLADTETGIASSSWRENKITKAYRLETVNPNNSYSVRLFGYPFWQDALSGYKIRWWLYNLDRNLSIDVTDKVQFSSATGGFDPTAYGYVQSKNVFINLKDVSPAFKAYVHAQAFSAILYDPLLGDFSRWTVVNAGSISQDPNYGTGLHAKIVTLADTTKKINLSNEFTKQEDWLQALYYNANPLQTNSEVKPPEPTHFYVGINDEETDAIAIANWNKDIAHVQQLIRNKTITIRFTKQTVSTELELGMSALMLY